MSVLKEEEWVFLNEITHMIYDTENLNEMRTNVLELLSILIPNSSASFYLGQPDGDKLLSDPVTINIPQQDITNYLDYGEKMDYTIPIFKSARPIAYKETDLFESRLREKTDFYNEFLAHGLEFPLALCIANEGVCYGALSLFRSKRMGDFSNRDVFILNQLQKHLVTKIRFEYSKGKNDVDHKTDNIKLEYCLTTRESEILELILKGFSNQEISCKLFIEEGTVKKHTHNIFYKFSVKNRIQLMRMCR